MWVQHKHNLNIIKKNRNNSYALFAKFWYSNIVFCTLFICSVNRYLRGKRFWLLILILVDCFWLQVITTNSPKKLLKYEIRFTKSTQTRLYRCTTYLCVKIYSNLSIIIHRNILYMCVTGVVLNGRTEFDEHLCESRVRQLDPIGGTVHWYQGTQFFFNFYRTASGRSTNITINY